MHCAIAGFAQERRGLHVQWPPRPHPAQSSHQEVPFLASSLAPAIIEELFRKARADRWLARVEFTDAVDASVARTFAGAAPSRRELERYLAGLHVEDLAIAAACALGRDAAWDHFVLEHRPVLYRAADALDPTGGGRELADSLYADLYGTNAAGAGRRPLFRYFHGRSSLATWLRAVLAQRHVDVVRARKRVEQLPEEETALPAAAATSTDPDRALLVPLVGDAMSSAINELPARDRLRLRSYYLSQLTLAQIGRLMGEHEATVSRHLSRARRILRDDVERRLREQSRLADAQIARAFELVLEDPGGMDLQQVFEVPGDAASDRKEPPQDRSK